MRTATIIPLLLLLQLGAGSVPLEAQGPLSLEARVGASLPVGSYRSATLAEPGPGFGLHFVYRRSARRSFYIGFDQHRFGCDPESCRGEDLVSTGWTVGTRLRLRPETAFMPWLGLGMLFDRLEGELGPADAALADQVSDLGLGGEVGVGALVRVGGRFSASPGVRYRLVNTRFDDAGLVRLRYLVADLGIVLGF